MWFRDLSHASGKFFQENGCYSGWAVLPVICPDGCCGILTLRVVCTVVSLPILTDSAGGWLYLSEALAGESRKNACPLVYSSQRL